MSSADSTIRVNIIGDAQSLQKAAGKAEGAIGGMNKKLLAAGGVIAGSFAVDQLIEFGNTAVKEADRVADAAGRVEKSLGPELSKAIIDRADDFSRFGASEGDMLELEARILDIGTAAGISKEQLAPFSESAATLASALEGATDVDAATWIEKIGKAAATGNTRALQDLGIFVDDAAVAAAALAATGKDSVDALTDQELAAGRVVVVMEKLNEKYGDLLTSTPDLEGKQRDLNARFETFTGKVGDAIDGPLADLLTFIITGIDGYTVLAEKLDGAGVKFDDLLTSIKLLLVPWATFNDLVARAIDLLNIFNFTAGGPVGTRVPRLPTGGGLSSGGGLGPSTTNVYVQGGSPEVIEQSVRRAVEGIARRSGIQQ